MIKDIILRIRLDKLHTPDHIKEAAAMALKMDMEAVDARGRSPVFQIQARVYSGEPLEDLLLPIAYKPVKIGKTAVIVGSGPAGLFAALRLIEKGILPILLERGKDVRERRFDLKTLQIDGKVNPDSNYCFGEGGARDLQRRKIIYLVHQAGGCEKNPFHPGSSWGHSGYPGQCPSPYRFQQIAKDCSGHTGNHFELQRPDPFQFKGDRSYFKGKADSGGQNG